MSNKLKIKEFIKKYKDTIIFVFVGCVLIVILSIVFINSVSFFVKSIDSALVVNDSDKTMDRFNVDGLKKLGIVNE